MQLSRSNITLAIIAGVAAVATFFMTADADNTALTDPVSESELSTERAEAVFAGGCFWCVEADFDKVNGVVETISGYTGGEVENPTYKQVSYTETGHVEAVKVVYDPQTVSYSELVEYFWRHVDPTDDGGQFCDRGSSYLTGIFPVDAEQEAIARASKEAIDASGVLSKPIVTEIERLDVFWPGEDYHQDYYLKNRLQYSRYRRGCRRDARVESVWAGERIQNAASTPAGS